MDKHVELIYNLTGQTVETYPPEWAEGAPSSATCSVYDGLLTLDSTAEFSPTVTIDSVSTTVSSASGASQTNRVRLNLAATTDIAVGRKYLVTNQLTQRELVSVQAISTGSYVEVEDELKYDYGSSGTSTFVGVRMTFPVDATWIADSQNILIGARPPFKAVWAYTVNSIARRHYTYLRVARQYSKHGVTIRDLEEYWPDLANEEFKGQLGKQFAAAIDGAFDAYRQDVLMSGYDPSIIRNTETVDQLIRLKTLQIVAEAGVSPNGRDPELYVRERREAYNALLAAAIKANLKLDVDQSAGGGVTQPSQQELAFRR